MSLFKYSMVAILSGILISSCGKSSYGNNASQELVTTPYTAFLNIAEINLVSKHKNFAGISTDEDGKYHIHLKNLSNSLSSQSKGDLIDDVLRAYNITSNKIGNSSVSSVSLNEAKYSLLDLAKLKSTILNSRISNRVSIGFKLSENKLYILSNSSNKSELEDITNELNKLNIPIDSYIFDYIISTDATAYASSYVRPVGGGLGYTVNTNEGTFECSMGPLIKKHSEWILRIFNC